MRQHTVVAMACVALFAGGLGGCAQTGMFGAMNVTNTELGGDNYTIVASNLEGEANAGYLLGVSFPLGGISSSIALVRIHGSGRLYQEALETIWARFEKEHGPIMGRKLALANVRFDTDHLNLGLYTRASVSVRADVVEFLPK